VNLLFNQIADPCMIRMRRQATRPQGVSECGTGPGSAHSVFSGRGCKTLLAQRNISGQKRIPQERFDFINPLRGVTVSQLHQFPRECGIKQ
jgi:hypothetical protein